VWDTTPTLDARAPPPDHFRMLGPGDLASVEGDAAVLYRWADADSYAGLSMRELVRRLLGCPPRMARLRTQGTLARIAGADRIFVREGTPAARARWVAGHELAHWYYRRIGYDGADLEARCDALGACLVAPRPLVVQVSRELGREPIALAKALGTTRTLAALRLGETLGMPVAVVKARETIVRGDPWGWPETHDEMRQLERRRRLAPGLRRVRIPEEARRFALLVDDVEVA
jgi:hypothetical protein